MTMDWQWWAARPWGDWGTWAGAIGTVLAVVVALWQLRRDRLVREAEERKRRHREKVEKDEQARKEEQAQAELITAWIAKVHFWDTENDPADLQQGIVIHNSSQQAIFNVTVTTFCRDNRGQSFESAKKELVYIRSVPPGVWYTEAVPGFTSGSRDVVLPVSFTDRRGKMWKRQTDGKLESIDESEFPKEGSKIPVSGMRSIGSRDELV
ncbi:hypothetical protein [Luteococcus sp.]|uniref:hypothetical protein n=1 Tax=Luteococcus sp. TaxID=1969402 RepID=UPI003735D4AE